MCVSQDPLTPGVSQMTYTKSQPFIEINLVVNNYTSQSIKRMEFAPPKVSGSIPSGANFGGLSPYRVCSGFKRGPRKWAVGLVPSD